MRRGLLLILWAALLAAGLALAAGFLGALHPAGDTLGVFRLQFAALALVLALSAAALSRRRALPLAAALAALLAAAPAALSYRASAAPTAGPHALYQKNLYFRLPDAGAIIADIRASGAAVVTLQEVTEPNRAVMQALAGSHPVQAWCPYARSRAGGTAVLSAWPALGEPLCPEGGGLTAVRLQAPFGPVWAVSLHLLWPWPYGQETQAARVADFLAGLDGPVILGGDFNMAPWGWSLRRIARAAGTAKAGPTATTLAGKIPFAPLTIDHVLLPRGWRGAQEIRPELGSDHRGILVRFAAP